MSVESTKQTNEMYWRFNATELRDGVAGGSGRGVVGLEFEEAIARPFGRRVRGAESV